MMQTSIAGKVENNTIPVKTSTQILKDRLEQGDMERIAEITDLSHSMVVKWKRNERQSAFLDQIVEKYLATRDQLKSEAMRIKQLKTLPETY
jgi:hypothetical protein